MDEPVNMVRELPDDLQPLALRWLERLADRHPGQAPDAAAASLIRLVAISDFAGETLLRYWPRLGPTLERLDAPLAREALAEFADRYGQSDEATEKAKSSMRERRNLTLLHILWRDAAGMATVEETISDLSFVADQLLRAAAEYAERLLHERFGVVRDSSGARVPLLILGMGKLGGGELNFSSDIDIIFLYGSDGESDGRKSLHAQEYFTRLSRQIVELLDERTADGFVFRTDTRLRPFGDSGPPTVSFAALESYLVQHGRDWERYAYVKARLVGPQPPQACVDELFDNLVRPFVYRRYLDFGVFESLREMHALITAEVKRLDRADNVKLGPGGIREIEFIVQSFQLVRGGSSRQLQQTSLLRVLPQLVDGKAISRSAASGLQDAYLFLRRLENFIQAIRDKQTHELPVDTVDRSRLALAMGFDDWPALLARLDEHRAFVTRQFEEIAFRGAPVAADNSAARRITELWDAQSDEPHWAEALRDAGLDDADEIAVHVVAFQRSPATRKVHSRAGGRLREFIPRLIQLAGERQRPAVAVSRCLSVVEGILRRSAYIALLNENQLAAKRLVGLCERSAYIAAEIARFPVLLDELLDPRPIDSAISKAEIREELDDRLARLGVDDSESRMEALVQFQRAIMFRIAVADFNGTLPIMKVSDSLTFLAETVLEEVLAIAWRDLEQRHGVPTCIVDGKRRSAGFSIIAYGKLGGLELSYGSDLDIIFLHDSGGDSQTTNGDKPLDNSMFFTRLVRRLVHFLTTHTGSGALYEIDTRLRPSGRKGLLVTSVEAFERYQEENAWTWEHQALLRARAVAGDAAIGTSFARVRRETLTSRVRQESLREEVLEMRARMRTELDKSGPDVFDLKQGQGGIADIEFLVQYLVLRHAREFVAVIEYTDNIRQLDALADCGVISTQAAMELQDIYQRFRLRQHHLALNNEPGTVPVDEFVAERKAVGAAWDRVFGA